jgi:hypothetical protein
MDNIYEDLVKRYKGSADKEEESYKWYREQASNVNKKEIDQADIISERDHIPKISRPNLIGRLFMFHYLPKNRTKLKYYDSFPLVFPIKIIDDGFLGLNLHYLPLDLRANFMDSLYILLNSSNMESDNTRLIKLSYEKLESQRRFVGAYPCIKKYFHRRIRSRVAYIPPSEWELALFLPTQSFLKRSEATVWLDSRKQIRKKLSRR